MSVWGLGRVFKMIGDAVFEEKAGWRGVTKENTLQGSSTEEQQSQTAFFLKNPLDGGSFGRELRGCDRQSPLRGFSGRAASLPAKIPRRRTPIILKTRPNICRIGGCLRPAPTSSTSQRTGFNL
jgi:hypothetical protein